MSITPNGIRVIQREAPRHWLCTPRLCPNLSPVNCQLSYTSSASDRSSECEIRTVNCHLSPVNCQLSPINCQLSTVNCHLSTVNCQLSTVNCHLSTVNCQLLIVNCQRRSFAEFPQSVVPSAYADSRLVPLVRLVLLSPFLLLCARGVVRAQVLLDYIVLVVDILLF